MSKTVFFNIPAQGHINPSLPVIAELVRRGEQVICVNAEETRAAYVATGAQFVAYPYLPTLDKLVKDSNDGDLAGNALELVRVADLLLPMVIELIEREKPDYIIFDSLASWAKQAAGKLGIRAAAIFCTFVVVPGSRPPISPAMALGLAQMMSRVILRFPAYWQLAAGMRRAHGVNGVGLMNALRNTGSLNIVFTSARFMFAPDRVNSTYRFVGPSFSQRPADTDFPFDQITGHPVVYISLGTINNENATFYRQCFEAFGSYPAQFILSVGKRTEIASLGSIPANFIVRNFVPQLEILQRTDLFVTHGGMNSIHEGLSYNVPLVVIPQQFEQAMLALLVARHGAGVALGIKPPIGQVTTSEIYASVDQVLKAPDSYRAAARELGESFRTAGGYARAASELIAFGRG